MKTVLSVMLQTVLFCHEQEKEKGIFAGFSSGANVAAALQLLATICQGKTIVVLLSDAGLNYLGTDLWL
jgi:cysteine synthase